VKFVHDSTPDRETNCQIELCILNLAYNVKLDQVTFIYMLYTIQIVLDPVYTFWSIGLQVGDAKTIGKRGLKCFEAVHLRLLQEYTLRKKGSI